jgi:hypothetical protein
MALQHDGGLLLRSMVQAATAEQLLGFGSLKTAPQSKAKRNGHLSVNKPNS